jgi:hypothetical protein
MQGSRSHWLGVFAIVVMATPVWGSVQINFSDDENNPDPGFRIHDTNADNFSECIELGSNESMNTDNLDFQRISSAESTTNGAEILNYIVVMPELEITADLGDVTPFPGITISTFAILFKDSGTSMSSATFANLGGFRVYAAGDTTLSTPLLIADMEIFQNFSAIGGAGTFEAAVEMNLTNVRLDGSVTETTLIEFKQAADAAELLGDPLNGPDFDFNVSSAGSNIAEMIRAGVPPVIGSASGSIFAVPEPGTLVLLAAGAFAGLSRRRRSA